MERKDEAYRELNPRHSRHGVLLITLLVALCGPLFDVTAAAQEPPLPMLQPQLTPEVRDRLEEEARKPTLAPWQREFMLEVAHGTAGRRATGSSPALPGATQQPATITADDGTWTLVVPPSERGGHAAIYDPLRDRMVVFGGHDVGSLNDVWALSLSGSPVWTPLFPAGNPPSARYGHTAFYDPLRDRIVVFGGHNGSSYFNDVWALSLSGSPAWSAIVPAGGAPSARYSHTAIYDPVGDRMVLFGGYTGSVFVNDVWALSLSGSPAWSMVTPLGDPPQTRAGHTAFYDPVRDRMLVFGGGSVGSPCNDLWALSLGGNPAWSELAPAGIPPSPHDSHTAIYDPVRDRMVVFGGYDFSSGTFNDVLALSLSASPEWSTLTPAGGPPSMRYSHTAIYDPVRDRMVVFAGWDGGISFNDVWALSLSASPAWSALTKPSARSGHSAIYDPVRDRMLVFGGLDGSVVFLNDVWALSLAGIPAWSMLVPAGSPPPGRFGHTAIYDPVRDRMLVFGGFHVNVINDVWALSLSGSPAWSQLGTAGIPPSPRAAHTAIYDPVRDRMLVFGGYNSLSDLYFNDVWALPLSGSPTWTALTSVGGPPLARSDHTAIYDPVRDRMVVFGGYYDAGPLNDVWTLSLAGSPTWSAISAGVPPPGRRGHTAIYDPVRDRMVVLGGYDGSGIIYDVWALNLSGSPLWNALAPAGSHSPLFRYVHTAIYDPVRDRMVGFGGYDDMSLLGDVWALAWGPLVSVPSGDHPFSMSFALAAPRPNPSRGPVTLDFTLPQAEHVSLVLYDAAGRKVRELVDGSLSAGRHSIDWDGRDRNGRTVRAGTYLVRLTAPGAQVVRKAVVLGAGPR